MRGGGWGEALVGVLTLLLGVRACLVEGRLKRFPRNRLALLLRYAPKLGFLQSITALCEQQEPRFSVEEKEELPTSQFS